MGLTSAMRGVEAPSGDYCCPGRVVAVGGRTDLRRVPKLDQPAHGAVRPRGRGRIRAPLATPAYLTPRDPAGHGGAGAVPTQTARRFRSGRWRGHPGLAPDPPPPDQPVAGHDPPDPDPRRSGDPRAGQAAEGLLPALSGRDAER